MVIRVQAEGRRFTLPAPIRLARAALAVIPEWVLNSGVNPGDPPVDKEAILTILDAVSDAAGQNKGLEVVRVEHADRTFVSIVL